MKQPEQRPFKSHRPLEAQKRDAEREAEERRIREAQQYRGEPPGWYWLLWIVGTVFLLIFLSKSCDAPYQRSYDPDYNGGPGAPPGQPYYPK